MNTLETAWFKSKDLQLALALHGLVDASRGKMELLARMQSLELYAPYPACHIQVTQHRQPVPATPPTEQQQQQQQQQQPSPPRQTAQLAPRSKQPRITAFCPRTVTPPSQPTATPPRNGIESITAQDLAVLGWCEAGLDLAAELQHPALCLACKPGALGAAAGMAGAGADNKPASEQPQLASCDVAGLLLPRCPPNPVSPQPPGHVAQHSLLLPAPSAATGVPTRQGVAGGTAWLQASGPSLPEQPQTQPQDPASVPTALDGSRGQRDDVETPDDERPSASEHTSSQDVGGLAWLAHELLAFSQQSGEERPARLCLAACEWLGFEREALRRHALIHRSAGVMVCSAPLPSPQRLVSRRVGFLLLSAMDHRDACGRVEGTLQPGMHEGAVLRRMGSACTYALCDAGCPGGHDWWAVGVLAPLRRTACRLELTLDLAPRLRLTDISQLLGLAGQSARLQDVWLLLAVRDGAPGVETAKANGVRSNEVNNGLRHGSSRGRKRAASS